MDQSLNPAAAAFGPDRREATTSASDLFASITALILAGLLVAKLINPVPTSQVLRQVWHFSEAVSLGAFLALIAAEGVVVTLLILRRTRRLGSYLTIAFLILVSISPARQMIEGSEIGCGCGLGSSQGGLLDQATAIGKNVILALMAWLARP